MKGQKTGGRQKGTPNKATVDVKAAAREYGMAAIERLAHLMEHAKTEAAQVAAAKEILDRAYGKAAQHVSGDLDHIIRDERLDDTANETLEWIQKLLRENDETNVVLLPQATSANHLK